MATDSKNIKLCRVTKNVKDAFDASTPASGSVYWDETELAIRVGDGETAGGIPLTSKVTVYNESEGKSFDAEQKSGIIFGNANDKPFVESGKRINSVFVAGDNTMSTHNVRAFDVVAIGDNIMQEGRAGYHNIALGKNALRSNNATATTDGDRNVAIGSNSLIALTNGRQNVAIGRDTAQCVTTGKWNTVVGYRAMGGAAPISWGDSIAPQYSSEISSVTAIGSDSAKNITSGDGLVSVGRAAAYNLKKSSGVVAIGNECCKNVQAGMSVNGKTIKVPTEIDSSGNETEVDSIECGYTISTKLASITFTLDSSYVNHAVKNCYVIITAKSGILNEISNDVQYCYVSSVSGQSFTVETDIQYSGTISSYSGVATISGFEQSTKSSDAAKSFVVIGDSILENATSVDNGVCVGTGTTCATATSFEDSVVIGGTASQNASSVSTSVAIGRMAGQSSSTIEQDVHVGYKAGASPITSYRDVYIGYLAGGGTNTCSTTSCVGIGGRSLYTLDSSITSLLNSIAIGYGSTVTGSYQCQLGNSNVTTYAYGAVQDRSDARDKADIRDTVLGSDFILSLRPVDFKWDMRDDYVEVNDEDGTVTRHEKDGSKKRNRFHHGFIAQEVKAVMDAQGVDFGGYQDHSVNGGADVLSLGYEELIAPMVKTIQELNERIKVLEEKMK